MKKNKIKLKYLFNMDNYISKKDITMLFLLLVIGVLPTMVSGNPNFNSSEKLLSLLCDSLYNLIFFLGVILIMINIRKHICFNECFYARYNNSKDMISYGIKYLCVSVVIYYLSFIIVAIAGSIFYSLGCYQFSIYEKYNIPIIYYIIFKCAKNLILYLLVSNIIFVLSFAIRNRYLKYILSAILFVLFFLNFNEYEIRHFYQIPIFFQTHITSFNYISLYTEIIVYFIYILILSLFFKFIFNLSSKKKVFIQ